MNMTGLKNSLPALVVVLMLLGGCATAPSGSKFSGVAVPAADKAMLYVYRPNDYYAKAITFPLLLDNKKVADIGSAGFIKIPVAPGSHTLVTETASMIDDPITVAVKGGEIKFLRVSMNKHDPMGFSVSIYFKDVVRQLAEPEMIDTSEEVARYYGPKD
jgi:hypothetical protein